MVKIMLRSGLKGPFRRSVRDKKGNVTEVITFAAGVPVDCNQKQCEALMDDIGNAVAIATVKKSGDKEIVKEDWKSTVEAVVDVAFEKREKGLNLHAFQRKILDDYEKSAVPKQVEPENKGGTVPTTSGT